MSTEPSGQRNPGAQLGAPVPAGDPAVTGTRIIRVSAVILRSADGLVLNVRKRGTESFMLPGGKPEPGEPARDTAVREVAEELGLELDPATLTELGVFRAAAANEPGCVVEAAVFLHTGVTDTLAPRPQAEIELLEWISPASTRADLAPLNTDIIFPALRAQG